MKSVLPELRMVLELVEFECLMVQFMILSKPKLYPKTEIKSTSFHLVGAQVRADFSSNKIPLENTQY